MMGFWGFGVLGFWGFAGGFAMVDGCSLMANLLLPLSSPISVRSSKNDSRKIVELMIYFFIIIELFLN